MQMETKNQTIHTIDKYELIKIVIEKFKLKGKINREDSYLDDDEGLVLVLDQ